jgi:lipopolysaccharide assembly protein A
MRFLCFLFLLIFAGIVGAFAYFNQQEVTLKFFDQSLTAPIAAVAGGAYVLGMLSGWTIVGMIRRSVHYVTERPIVSDKAIVR